MAQDFEKNRPSVSEDDLEKIIQSKQAQALLALLQQDGGAALQQASQAAASGDYEKVRQLLAPKLRSVEAKQLLKELGQTDG